MGSIKKQLLFLQQLALLSTSIAVVLECSLDSLVKCDQHNSYRMCLNGMLIGPYKYCPLGKICVENSPQICEDISLHEYKNEFDDNEMENRISKINYCEPKTNYDLLMLKCNSDDTSEYQIVTDSGCAQFFHCMKKKIFQCPDGQFFDGYKCSSSFKCPRPCTLKSSDVRNMEVNVLNLYTNDLGRWPVSGSNCKIFVRWSFDKHKNIIGKHEKCPMMSWFDPYELRCRMRYLCEEDFHSAVQCPDGIDHGYCDPEFSLPACQENYQLLSVRDSGCHYYVSCENFKARLKKCPGDYLFNPETSTCAQNYSCLHPCELYPDIGFTANEPKVPECPTKNGLYEIPGSECSKYIKCERGNREILTCPSGTWFNPNLQLCTFNYKCHQIHCVPIDPQFITTKSIEKKTTVINITWNNEVENRQMDNFFTEKSSSTKTEKTTTINHQKEYNIPKCSFDGMIKIGQDGNCINYLNCTYTPDGWRGVIIYCGHLSIKLEKQTYPAEQNNKMITNELYVTEGIEMRNQFEKMFSLTETSTDHTNKIILNNNNIVRTLQTTQQETYDGSLEFESKYRNDNCLAPQKIVPQCKTHGTFPVMYSDCKEYVQCKFTLSLSSGPGWLSSLFTCNKGFLFDPQKGECSSNYTCDEVVPCERRNPLETANVYSQLEDPAFTICENGEILMVPKCKTKEPGRQAISGTGCKKYLVCTLHLGEFKAKIFNCPEFYYFDPKKYICDPNYKCEDEDFCADKKLDITVYDQQIYTCPENGKELAIPRCESRGRFRFENTGCKKFLECIETDHGLIPKVSNCPTERYFDPETETCEFENTCLDIDMCSSYNLSFIQCPNGYIIQLPTCQNFGLKAVGGTGCKKYIQCFRAYSRYYSVIDCADGTFFNPDKLKCESSYRCSDKNFCTVQPKVMKSIFSLANKKNLLPIYYNFTRHSIEHTTKVYKAMTTVKSKMPLSTKSKSVYQWFLQGKDHVRDTTFYVPLPTIKTKAVLPYTKPVKKPFNSRFINRRIPEKYSSIKTTTIKTTTKSKLKHKNRWENNIRTKATTRRTTKRKRFSTKHIPNTTTPKSFIDWLFPLRKATTKKTTTLHPTTTTTQKSLLKLFSIFD